MTEASRLASLKLDCYHTFVEDYVRTCDACSSGSKGRTPFVYATLLHLHRCQSSHNRLGPYTPQGLA